ncbi:hypothetical protein BH11MYX4_BH11MYX4_57750 [soil metagenome]
MKNALFAVVCTLGAVACGESRPAETPASETTSTTVMTETSAVPASATQAKQTPTAGMTTPPVANRNPTPSTPPTATGLDATRTPKDASDTPMAGTAPVAQTPGAADNTKDATNTKINDRDRPSTALTPMDQGGGKDRDITAAIRRSVVADSSLSFNAKNVKIITVGGKVTLRGPVKSDAEKATIESKAKSAPGVTEVDNQLEVKK